MTEHHQYELKVTLEIQGPFLTKSSVPGRYGVDAPLAKNSSRQLILPGSLVKGRLREACRLLAAAVPGKFELSVGDWFGQETGETLTDLESPAGQEKNFRVKPGQQIEPPKGTETSWAPNRGRLQVGDFVFKGTVPLDEKASQAQEHHAESPNLILRQRIRLDPDRRAAAEGALQTVESLAGPDEMARFDGCLRFWAEPDEARQVTRCFHQALRWVSGFGAQGSTGFGHLRKAALVLTEAGGDQRNTAPLPETTGYSPAPLKDDRPAGRGCPVAYPLSGRPLRKDPTSAFPTRLGLVITLTEPFCLAKHRVASNLFESEVAISGGVLKGCVATAWAARLGKAGSSVSDLKDPRRSALGKYFDKIRFTHAFPAAVVDGAFFRPVAPPLSLVAADGAIYDVALTTEPSLIGGQAPSFQIDWKDSHRTQARRHFPFPDLDQELRVRTAIDPATGAAETDRLFAYEMVVPAPKREDAPAGNGQPPCWHWLTWVDLGNIEEKDRQAVSEQLEDILRDGLSTLGKTKARAKASLLNGTEVQPAWSGTPEPIGGAWVLTLQTPALLIPWESLDEAAGEAKLFSTYQEAFDDISKHSLELIRFFARQTLAGGRYLYRRFQEGLPEYRPFVLTERGSVFLLRAKPGKHDQARKKIRLWIDSGLPLPAGVISKYGGSWNKNPYIPENGFGEIVVNLPIHWTGKPERPWPPSEPPPVTGPVLLREEFLLPGALSVDRFGERAQEA